MQFKYIQYKTAFSEGWNTAEIARHYKVPESEVWNTLARYDYSADECRLFVKLRAVSKLSTSCAINKIKSLRIP